MIPIPEELLEQVERGNVLLFIGERIVRDASGHAALDRLTERLAARGGLGDAEGYTFPEVAQAYEDDKGRHALVQFVRDYLEQSGDEPQPVHRLIAGLTQCNVLVTTALNRRLERAFAEARRPLDIVISDEDVPFEDETRARLYKLRGALDRVETLILTEDDHERFFEDQAGISVVLQGYLARKTILFVGYDLDDPYFKQLYRKVTAALDDFVRRAYAFGETPPPQVARWCRRHGINVVEADAAAFLQSLVDQLADRVRPPSFGRPATFPTDGPLPDHPYKLLDYYEAQDAGIFFGRQQETQDLSSRIHAHRLTLLFGASGVGKTSLLLAGAVPRLEHADPPYTTIYARALDDPAQVIRHAVQRRLPDAELAENGALVEFLAAATRALGHTLVLVLDQFEEFFIRLSPQFRAAFIGELGALCDASDVPVKVVLSLREDWLAAINELEQRIPEVFRNRMRVLPLTREQARESITAPVERLGARYEPELVERLLGDLAGSAGANVMPPQLQLVCSALYGGLKPGERLIPLAAYEQLGGARGVLQQYLDDELARLPHDERKLARAALEDLVTSQGTKAVKTADEVALALDVAGDDLAPVLETLVRARLLRAIEREDGATAYELAHEYLIREIGLGAEAQARKQAEELIQHEVENWRRFGTMLAADKLALINDARAVLRLGPEAQELLLRSALEVGDEIEYWLDRMSDPAQRARVLADKARTRVAAVRRRTATVLGTQDVPESVAPLLELAVGDADPAVRAAARASLAKLTGQRPAIVERLRAAAASKDRSERRAAMEALARLPLRDLPRGLRTPVVTTRTRLWVAQTAAWTLATPLRRAMALTAGLLLVLLALTYAYSASSYYVAAQHVDTPFGVSDDLHIVIRRGDPSLPLPGLHQIVVDTGMPISRVQPDHLDDIYGRRLHGFWMLRGNRAYQKWGNDVANALYIGDRIPMLWHLDQTEGIAAILEATRSKDPGYREWGVQALGEVAVVHPGLISSQVMATLLALLKDPRADAVVRSAAAGALGQVVMATPALASAPQADALLVLLKDPQADSAGRSAAAGALGQVVTANPTLATSTTDALLALLKDPQAAPPLRASAAEALGQIVRVNPALASAPQADALLALLEDPQTAPDVRASAAAALGQVVTANPTLASASQAHALLALLKDPQAAPPLRASAAEALGQIVSANRTLASAPQADALLTLLKDRQQRSDAVAAALGQVVTANPALASAPQAHALLALLKGPQVDHGESAVVALGQVLRANPALASAPQADTLLALLKDPRVGRDGSARFAAALGQVVTANPVLASTLQTNALLALLPSLRYDLPTEYTLVAWALGQIVAANPAQADALLALLKDPQAAPPLRASAAEALGQVVTATPALASAPQADALLALLKDPQADLGLRYNAAEALGQIVTATPALASAPQADALLALLKDPQAAPPLRASAAEALGQVVTATPALASAPQADALLALLKDLQAGFDVRASAAEALGWRASAAEALGQVVTANPALASAPQADALLALMKDTQAVPFVRTCAVDALVRLYAQLYRQPDQWDELFDRLTHPRNTLERPFAARTLFLIALNNRDHAQALRSRLETDQYARSHEPVARIWSNKALAMLDIVDMAHAAESQAPEERKQTLSKIESFQSTRFFGEDFTWAAQQSLDWLEEREPKEKE